MCRLIAGVIALLFCVVAMAQTGCVTENVKKGTRRAEKVLVTRGTEGDELAGACGVEMGQVNKELGADKIPDSEIVVTKEAALAGADAIAADMATRAKIKQFFLKAAEALGSKVPIIGGAIAFLTTVGGLVLKLKKTGAALVESKGAVNAAVNLFESIKAKAADKKLTMEEFSWLMAEAKKEGSVIKDGARSLYDAYKAWDVGAKRAGEKA